MLKRCLSICLLFSLCAGNAQTPVFRKQVVLNRFVAEGAAVADVNGDGRPDILTGPYWFEAPSWKQHLVHADTTDVIPGYSASFLNYAMDVNQDGKPDLIRFDQPGAVCVWYEQPADLQQQWRSHLILDHAGTENPFLEDVNGDGRPDILCNDAEKKQVVWMEAPSVKGDTVWKRHVISDDPALATHKYTHGLGRGDINGDGRKDILVQKGWWEAPVDPARENWTFHATSLGQECANMFVYDVNKDGRNDVISSSAHEYGVWWLEQLPDGSFKQHEIDRSVSQTHGMLFTDINGDGIPDIITGKRYRAHNDNDPGAADAPVIQWFALKPGKKPAFTKHLIDNQSGIGLSFVVADMNGDGKPDIVVSNKKGVFCFTQ